LLLLLALPVPRSLTLRSNFSADQHTRVSLFVWRLGLLSGDTIANVLVHGPISNKAFISIAGQ